MFPGLHTNIVNMDGKAYNAQAQASWSDDMYLILSYAGKNLEDLGPASADDAFTMIKQLTEAVTFLRDEIKASHHDLKKDNVMWKPSEKKICIIDFGAMTNASGLTLERAMAWSPSYASKEFEEGAGKYHSFHPAYRGAV